MPGRVLPLLVAMTLMWVACDGSSSTPPVESGQPTRDVTTTVLPTTVFPASTSTTAWTEAEASDEGETTPVGSSDMHREAAPILEEWKRAVLDRDGQAVASTTGPQLSHYLDTVVILAGAGTRADIEDAPLHMGWMAVWLRSVFTTEQLAELDGTGVLAMLVDMRLIGLVPSVENAVYHEYAEDDWQTFDSGYINTPHLFGHWQRVPSVIVDPDVPSVDIWMDGGIDNEVLIAGLVASNDDERTHLQQLMDIAQIDDSTLDRVHSPSVWLGMTASWETFASAWAAADWETVTELAVIDTLPYVAGLAGHGDRAEFALLSANDALLGAYLRATGAALEPADVLGELVRAGLLVGNYEPADHYTWRPGQGGTQLIATGGPPVGHLQWEEGVWVVHPVILTISPYDFDGVNSNMDPLSAVLAALEHLLGSPQSMDLFD